MENAEPSHATAPDRTAAAGSLNSDQIRSVDASETPEQFEPNLTRTNQENHKVEEGQGTSTSSESAEPMTTEQGEAPADPATMGASFHASVASGGTGPPATAPPSLHASPEPLPGNNTPAAETDTATSNTGGTTGSSGIGLSQPLPTPPTTAPCSSPPERNPAATTNTNGGHFSIAITDDEEELGADNDDDDKIRYTDEDIQRDASSIAVMAMVNVALIFFAGIFVCAIAGSILFMGQFGFVTLCIVICLVGIVVGTVAWIIKIITGDKKLRPVQRKMRRWRAIAKAVVVNEIINFRLDMREHLLLTNGGECGDPEDDGSYEEMDASDTNDGAGGQQAPSATDSSARTASNSRSRSVIFGLMVRPFVKGKKKIKRKLGRKNNGKDNMAATTESAEGGAYVPPAVSTEMV